MSGELDFDSWAALSARLSKRIPREREAIVAEAKLEPEDWEKADKEWRAALAADLDAGDVERPKRYGAICAAEVERRKKEPPPAPAPDPDPAPEELQPEALTEIEEPAAPEVAVPSFLKELDRPPEPLPAPASPPAPHFAGTMLAIPAPTGPAKAVPFGAEASPEFSAFLASSTEKEPAPLDKGGTVAVPASGPGSTVAAPAGGFQDPSVPFAGGAAQVMGFTVEQYASLTAELTMSPNQAAAVLARYGLPDEAARKKLADAWGRRLVQEPGLLRKWTELCDTYRGWLRQQRR